MSLRATHTFEEHTSEVRIALRAATAAELFEEAGRALAEVLTGGVAPPPSASEPVLVSLRSTDRDALLVDWMNELVFRFELTGEVPVDIHVDELGKRELSATIRGARIGRARTLVKAATMHDVRIEEQEHGVSASVVLDV